MIGCEMNNELERMWQEVAIGSLVYYSDTYLERVRKTTKTE
jgi:hypothetical protein